MDALQEQFVLLIFVLGVLTTVAHQEPLPVGVNAFPALLRRRLIHLDASVSAHPSHVPRRR